MMPVKKKSKQDDYELMLEIGAAKIMAQEPAAPKLEKPAPKQAAPQKSEQPQSPAPATSKPPEQPQTLPNPTTVSLKNYRSRFSIQDIGKEKGKQQKDHELHLPDVADNFSETQLEESWKILCESFKDKDRLYIAMKKAEPRIKENFVVAINFDNELLKTDLEERMQEVRQFFFKHLNNSRIRLEINIKEGEMKSAKPYSAVEKFQHMAQKNPVLRDMQAKFNLKPEM